MTAPNTITIMNLFGRHIQATDGVADIEQALDLFYQSEPRPDQVAVQLNGTRTENFGQPLRNGDVVLVLEGGDASKRAHSGA